MLRSIILTIKELSQSSGILHKNVSSILKTSWFYPNKTHHVQEFDKDNIY